MLASEIHGSNSPPRQDPRTHLVGRPPECPAVIERAGRGTEGDRARMLLDNPRPEPCSICEEPSPTISYFWPGGLVVRVHAACAALWKLERGWEGGPHEDTRAQEAGGED